MELKSDECLGRRVLVIAYYFPPCGGGGVQRIAKFVRYLPEFGWLPTVLTVAPSYYRSNKDPSHVVDFPNGVEIIRTPEMDPVRASTRSGSVPNEVASHMTPIPPARWIGKLGSFRRRETSDGFRRDEPILWCARAVRAGMRAHFRRRFDLILATGEPYSDFLIALMLSRLTRVPFVVDMRDPWTIDPYRAEDVSAMRQLVQRWEERRVLSACSACIFANRSITDYEETFPRWKKKFYYISNGYDSADFAGVEPKQFDKFTIVHNGNFLSGYRTADTFLIALKNLLSTRLELRKRMQVLFVGRIGEEEKLIQDLSLGDVVQQTGYMPHQCSIEYVKGADLLLLVGGRHQWEETAKVYEYFAAGKPILALVRPDGAAADLLRQYSLARVVDRENVEEVKAAIGDALANRHVLSSVLSANSGAWAARYERRWLTGQLAQILAACLESPETKV